MAYDIPGGSEQVLYAKAKEYAPDLMIYVGSRWGQQPAIATLARMTSQIAPMVHICSDAADYPWHDLLREYHEKGAFTLQVAIDGSTRWPGALSGLTLLTPIDPKHFPDRIPRHGDRRIHCGFAGNAGAGDGSKRTALLSALLKDRLIDVRVRSNLPYTYEGMCEYLTECRVVLNISYTGSEQTKHVKGRVVEAGLAGACLLETAGTPTSDWFTPGEDYLEYASIEQAGALIRELANDPARTQMLADNLERKVRRNHSPREFWNAIFSRIGLRTC